METCPTCGLDPEDFSCPDPCHRSELERLREAVAWLGDIQRDFVDRDARFAAFIEECLEHPHLAAHVAMLSAHEGAKKQ